MFYIVGERRKKRLEKLAIITRSDTSRIDLEKFKRQGYKYVIFVQNVLSDPDCKQHNGEIYLIDDLLKLDHPLYRVSHPNCNCGFRQYVKKKKEIAQNPNMNNPQIDLMQKPEVPPTTITNVPQTPKV